LAIIQNPDESVVRIRAGFFALAHFASVPATRGIVESFGIPDILIGVASRSTSYVLKGTLIVALSLFAQSQYFSSVLQKHNWQLFRFGCHQSVIPCDPSEFLKDRKTCEVKFPTVPDGPDRHAKVIAELRDLSNSLIHVQSEEILTKMKEANDPCFKDPELALVASQLIGGYAYETAVRQTIYKWFTGTPLVPPVREPLNDDEASAIVAVKIREILVGNQARSAIEENWTFKNVEIPRLSQLEIAGVQSRRRAPEVYMDPEEFEAVVHMTKEEFYLLNREQQTSIRERLMTSP
jgi:hypothetical protein